MSDSPGSANFSGSDSTRASRSSFGKAKPIVLPSREKDRETICPIRNLTRPRTRPSLLRGSFSATARTSSIVTITVRLRRTVRTPSADDVRRIVAIENPVIRNLEITECYSQLSAAFAARSGEGANWCTYATWASRQAGSTIRGEDLVASLQRKLPEGRWLLHPFATLGRRLVRRGLFQHQTRLGRATAELHAPFDAVELASDAVARGNLKVFEEIGLEFARYLNGEQSLDGLRPGDPPEGQRYLRQAFMRFDRMRLERDPKTRMELAVLANLEIGFHEQTRLQPEIREALDAAYRTPEDLGRRTLVAVVPGAARWWSIVRRPAAALAGAVAAGAQRSASRLAREVITESFMVMSLPGRVLA